MLLTRSWGRGCYDPNGGVFRGKSDITTIKYHEGTKIEIAEAPTREGYTFLYWKGSEYDPGDEYEVNEEHTFVAQWEKDEEPVEPDDPEEPDKPANKKAIVKAKQKEIEIIETGDETGNGVFITFFLSAVLLLSLLRRRKSSR